VCRQVKDELLLRREVTAWNNRLWCEAEIKWTWSTGWKRKSEKHQDP
jgi:hypothetical protein